MFHPALFGIFCAIAIPTILTPGPGVLMSLTNTLRFGLRRATPGIIGVALGTFVIAAISATGIGVLLSTSQTAYDAVKICGILFMFYLGWKRWKAATAVLPFVHHAGKEESDGEGTCESAPWRLFFEGILLQLSNPQLIIFYIALFPQCIEPASPYLPQFFFLSACYTFFVWLIHSGYGWLALRAAEKFMTAEAGRYINRASAVAFWIVSLWLLSTLVHF